MAGISERPTAAPWAGSFVGLLLQRGNIQIDHAILGSSDLDQSGGLSARLRAKLVSHVLYRIFQKGKLPDWMQKRLEKKQELLICHPEKWADEVRSCCEMEKE